MTKSGPFTTFWSPDRGTGAGGTAAASMGFEPAAGFPRF